MKIPVHFVTGIMYFVAIVFVGMVMNCFASEQYINGLFAAFIGSIIVGGLKRYENYISTNHFSYLVDKANKSLQKKEQESTETHVISIYEVDPRNDYAVSFVDLTFSSYDNMVSVVTKFVNEKSANSIEEEAIKEKIDRKEAFSFSDGDKISILGARKISHLENLHDILKKEFEKWSNIS